MNPLIYPTSDTVNSSCSKVGQPFNPASSLQNLREKLPSKISPSVEYSPAHAHGLLPNRQF